MELSKLCVCDTTLWVPERWMTKSRCAGEEIFSRFNNNPFTIPIIDKTFMKADPIKKLRIIHKLKTIEHIMLTFYLRGYIKSVVVWIGSATAEMTGLVRETEDYLTQNHEQRHVHFTF